MNSTRENRRQRLEILIEEAGGQAALAERLRRDRNQVWQWTLAESDARGRGIGPKMARLLEATMGKPHGWMDQPPPERTEVSPPPAENTEGSSSPTSHAVRPDTDTLRTAMEITDRVLANARVAVTPTARTDITLALYDLLREGQGIAAAERTVSHMLRAVGGLTATTR